MKLGLLVAVGCGTLVSGCVAPLAAGLAAGAGIFGVNAAGGAISKKAQAGDDRLRYVTGASLGVSSVDIASISEKDWKGDILYWVATHRNGNRFRCEQAAGTAHCTPYTP